MTALHTPTFKLYMHKTVKHINKTVMTYIRQS